MSPFVIVMLSLAVFSTLQQQCRDYQVFDGEECVCMHGYERDDIVSNCKAICGKNQLWTEKEGCLCMEGYAIYRGACVRCPEIYQMKPGSYCLCPPNHKYDSQAVTCNPDCGENQIEEDQSCKCRSGFVMNNADFCVLQCQSGYQWDQSKSQCVENTLTATTQPNAIQSQISLMGAVRSSMKVIQGIHLNKIPAQLILNRCQQCSSLLNIRILSSDLIPIVRVIHLPNKKSQYLVEFDFKAFSEIPVFEFMVQINPAYKRYFSFTDLGQKTIKTIDSSMLQQLNQPEDSPHKFITDSSHSGSFGANI